MFFSNPNFKFVVGVVHVQALPGTPMNKYSFQEIIEKAIYESMVYMEEGVDSILFENMHDRPYLNREVGPEIIASMTSVCGKIRELSAIPMGIQILAGANIAALAVAKACNLQYIRAEGFVFSHVADEGMMHSDAGELLRYRKSIGADTIKIFTDIKKKHSAHAITNDVSISETAKAARFFLSDGVIVTGSSTGVEVDVNELKKVKKSVELPVIIGSGITTDNISKFFPFADGFIVGSALKEDGAWYNDADRVRVRGFMDEIDKLRK